MAEPDEQRFERLYRQHFDRVAAYLMARADRDEAGDALARTFEIAWRRLDDIPEAQLPWLLGVARRVLADARRSQGRRAALIERIAAAGAGSGDDPAGALIERELAVAALAALSGSDQEALLLIAWDGLSQREAAAVLGCSRGAFALRLRRARARLRAAVDELPREDTVTAATSATAPAAARGQPAIGRRPAATAPSHQIFEEIT